MIENKPLIVHVRIYFPTLSYEISFLENQTEQKVVFQFCAGADSAARLVRTKAAPSNAMRVHTGTIDRDNRLHLEGSPQRSDSQRDHPA